MINVNMVKMRLFREIKRMAFHRESLTVLFFFSKNAPFFQQATFKYTVIERSWVEFILSTTPWTSIELHQHLSHLL